MLCFRMKNGFACIIMVKLEFGETVLRDLSIADRRSIHRHTDIKFDFRNTLVRINGNFSNRRTVYEVLMSVALPCFRASLPTCLK